MSTGNLVHIRHHTKLYVIFLMRAFETDSLPHVQLCSVVGSAAPLCPQVWPLLQLTVISKGITLVKAFLEKRL